MIWDLEKSENVLDRRKYANRIKTFFIPETKKKIIELSEWKEPSKLESIPQEDWDKYVAILKEKNEYALHTEKRFLKALKVRLSEYDIYKQNMASKCQMCHEVECVCYVIEEDKKFTEEVNKLF